VRLREQDPPVPEIITGIRVKEWINESTGRHREGKASFQDRRSKPSHPTGVKKSETKTRYPPQAGHARPRARRSALPAGLGQAPTLCQTEHLGAFSTHIHMLLVPGPAHGAEREASSAWKRTGWLRCLRQRSQGDNDDVASSRPPLPPRAPRSADLCV
jgi:hypothetical protein